MNDPQGTPASTNISFEQLRAIAEAASGARDTHTWFVRHGSNDPERRGRIDAFTQEPQEGKDYLPGALVIPVWQDPGIVPPPPATAPTWGRLGFSAAESLDLMDVLRRIAPDRGKVAADSVFWTESAVEKFVVPYYASVSGPDAAGAVRRVLDVLHRKSPRRAPDDRSREPLDGEAFALVHIPTSEYFQGDLTGNEYLAATVRDVNWKREVELVSLGELEGRRTAAGWPAPE